MGLLLLVRLVASYWQQAFLWDAALNSVYNVRVFVFDKVLQRDLGFSEGGDAVSPGDIAYRITAEAKDVADTVYALLNVRNFNIKRLYYPNFSYNTHADLQFYFV